MKEDMAISGRRRAPWVQSMRRLDRVRDRRLRAYDRHDCFPGRCVVLEPGPDAARLDHITRRENPLAQDCGLGSVDLPQEEEELISVVIGGSRGNGPPGTYAGRRIAAFPYSSITEDCSLTRARSPSCTTQPSLRQTEN